jgi:hypothetical protein
LVPGDCYDLRSFGALAWKVATLLLLKAWKALLVRLFIACFFFWPFYCRSLEHEPHVLLTVVTSCTCLTELQHLNINSCYFVDSSFQKLEGQSF